MSKIIPFMEFIAEEMEQKGLTVQSVSDSFGISMEEMVRIVKNKKEMNEEVAQKFSDKFGQSPEYWINLSNNSRK